MKIQTTGMIAASGGMQGKTGYKIVQNAKVMDIFSNALYKDKPRAVVRELSTNAWDAHIMAGTTGIAPQMHLPNGNNKTFYIRDFGTGMSRDQMEHMYQTYGVSTKDESNDFNGCMGIGSKSPFAYARSFVTTSFYNGKKYIYINAKDDKNMPQLNFAGEFDTDEPNGLKVEVNVLPQDFRAFQQAAEAVVQWFPQPFEILNCPGFRRQRREYVREGDGWKIRQDTNTSCAIMGFVEYPIEAKHFSDKDATRDVHWYQYQDKTPVVRLLNLGLELHFGIGEVEMDAAREGLQYTPDTIKQIRLRLEQVLADLKADASKEFAACKNLWDARCKYWEFNKGALKDIRELIAVTGVEWKGHKLNEAYDVEKMPKGVKIVYFSQIYTQKPKREEHVYKIVTDRNVVFMEGDMERGNYVSVERYMDANNKCNQVYLVTFEDDKAKQEFIKFLDIDPSLIVKTSSVPKPPKQARVKQERVFIFKKQAAGTTVYGDRNSQNQYWSEGGVDFKAGGLYVELNNWNVFSGGKALGNAAQLHEVITALEDLGVQVPAIAGIKTSAIKRYENSDKWTDFYAWAKQNIQNKVDTQKAGDILKQSAAYRQFTNYEGGSFYTNLVSYATDSVQKTDGLFKEMLDKLASYRKMYEVELPKVQKIDRILTMLGLSGASVGGKDTSLIELDKKVRAKYTFLILVGPWDVSEKAKANAVINLINLFDSQS